MSIDEFAIDFERDGALDLYYAMFGAEIKDILVNGIPIDDVDYPYCSNITIVLDTGTRCPSRPDTSTVAT